MSSQQIFTDTVSSTGSHLEALRTTLRNILGSRYDEGRTETMEQEVTFNLGRLATFGREISMTTGSWSTLVERAAAAGIQHNVLTDPSKYQLTTREGASLTPSTKTPTEAKKGGTGSQSQVTPDFDPALDRSLDSPTGAGADSTAPSTGSGGGGSGVGGGSSTGGGAGGTSPGLPEEGTPRQIPGGGEVWKVGNDWYLAYTVPGTEIPLVWKVESEARLKAIFPAGVKPDRTMNNAQFEKTSPWLAGLAAELAVHDEDPWQVFLSQHEQHIARKPWLSDPTVIAVMAVAHLEGRTPTADELAETDWWQDHSAEERELMVSLSDAGRTEARNMVKEIHEEWLGKTFGKVSEQQLDKWVDRFMENTDSARSLLDGLKGQRKALFPDFDENLTWNEIVTPTRNLAENVWGQPFDDDKMLVDLVNKRDYNKAAQTLREEGLNRDVTQVVNDALSGLSKTTLGQQVVRSGV